MATSRAQSKTQSKTTATPKREFFLAPDAVLARIWTPSSACEREALDDALVPTLRRYADALIGRAREPRRGEVMYASAEGLRYFLLYELTRERPECPWRTITPAMCAYAWHRKLSSLQRETLATFAASGYAGLDALREQLKRGQHGQSATPSSTRRTLFDVA